MELYQIRYFLSVCDTLNFTRAAERCFVSQPALTKAIQKLEDILGGRLFDRTKNSVSLTAFGQAMRPHLTQVYTATTQTREQARRLTREQREPIRAGIMCTIEFSEMLPGFLDFQQAHPEIDVQFREGTLESLTDQLDRGEIEVALLASPYEIPKRFRGPVLFRERYVIAHGDAHRFGECGSIRLADINAERYCNRTLCEFSDFIGRVMEQHGIDVETVQDTSREDWIQSLVRSNLGIAFMPESTALGAQIPHVQLSDHRFVREVRALAQAERPSSPAIDTLLDALAAHAWPQAARAADLGEHCPPHQLMAA